MFGNGKVRQVSFLGLIGALVLSSAFARADSKAQGQSDRPLRKLIQSINLAEEIEAINRGELPMIATPRKTLKLRDTIPGGEQVQASALP
jgi:hypothetical protein